MMPDIDTPDLVDVLEAFRDSILAGINTAFPGKVQSYDATKRTANIKPMKKYAIESDDGDVVSESLPVLPNVPICFPGMGQWTISMPVSVGDWVIVLCCDSSIGHVRATGELMEPGDLRRHHLSHAIAIPGFFPSSQAISADTDGMVIQKAGGGPKIKLTSDDIIFNGGTQKVARVGDSIELKSVTFSPGSGGATLSINGHAITPTPTNIDAGDITGPGADHVKA